MINVVSSPASLSTTIAGIASSAIGLLERIPVSIPQVLFRGAMALTFWRSAQTKLVNWDLTVQLFQNEYKVPVLPPELAAQLATGVELAAPMLLVLGLATRLGAGAMLAMTLVIQLFVYPQSYPDHLLWAGPLLYLILRGPGTFSIDCMIRRKFFNA